VPAKDHQVGAGRRADQRGARVAVLDSLLTGTSGYFFRQLSGSLA
jgi:hypothetical protein